MIRYLFAAAIFSRSCYAPDAEGYVRPSTIGYYLLSLFLSGLLLLWEPALIPVVMPDFILLVFILPDFILELVAPGGPRGMRPAEATGRLGW